MNSMDIVSLPIVINKKWIDSRFRMVVLATERAKQLMSGAKPVIPTKYIKAATIALHEISECPVDYVIGKEARKAMQAAAAAKLLKAAEGAEVTVVMTVAAAKFISPLTFQVLSKRPVLIEMFDLNQGSEITHIYLGRNADMILIAPATANMIGKMASGICDDLLSTILGAVNCPVVMAPAMDFEMYDNPVVRRNIASLRQIGVDFIGPQSGSLASGATGIGRMSEPEEILSFVVDKLTVHNDMEGKVILVTAGPTRESIDPVRYISNTSSGKMGYAIAGAAKRRGGKVIMISGPTALTPPSGIDCIHVTTAEEMYTSVMNRLAEADVGILAGARRGFRAGA